MPQPPMPGEPAKSSAPNLNIPKGMDIPKPPKIDTLNAVAVVNPYRQYTQTRNGPTIFPKNIGLHDTGNDVIKDVGDVTKDLTDKGVNKVTDLLAGDFKEPAAPNMPSEPIKPNLTPPTPPSYPNAPVAPQNKIPRPQKPKFNGVHYPTNQDYDDYNQDMIDHLVNQYEWEKHKKDTVKHNQNVQKLKTQYKQDLLNHKNTSQPILNQYKQDLINHKNQVKQIQKQHDEKVQALRQRHEQKKERIRNRLNTVVRPMVNNIKTVPVGEGDGNALWRSLEKAPQNISKLWHGNK